MNKKLSIAMGIALAGLSTAASADFSANVALSSDYVWRGVSQTNEDPAVSGGFDYEHESGFSIGTWASNVDFQGTQGVDDPSLELDVYAGYGTEISGIGVSVGVIAYTYHGDNEGLDFEEGNLGVSYGPFSAMVSHDFSNDNTYLEAGLDFEVGDGFGIGLHVGDYDFDAGGDYTDWSLGVSKEVGGFGFGLTYHDTDISGSDIADDRFVFSVSKSL